jgi:hypothetical protein
VMLISDGFTEIFQPFVTNLIIIDKENGLTLDEIGGMPV